MEAKKPIHIPTSLYKHNQIGFEDNVLLYLHLFPPLPYMPKSTEKIVIRTDVNEVQVQLNGTKKRCDTVLYRRDLTARMIVEYKAPEVEITQKVFDQITRYNMVLKVDYLIVSNGIRHYCCRMDYEQNSYTFLQDIPDYASL